MTKLLDFTNIKNVYLVCGKTDLRKGIDGLSTVIKDQFELDPWDSALFLFCGSRKDRFKAIFWEGDGWVLLYKRYESGHLRWPQSKTEVKELTKQQLEWLLTGLAIEPSVHGVKPGKFY